MLLLFTWAAPLFWLWLIGGFGTFGRRFLGLLAAPYLLAVNESFLLCTATLGESPK
jgi:hypothetical protein